MKDYFPARLAMGERFCNRVSEQTLLKAHIAKGRHTLLVSPRRYGKSSLVHKVVKDLKTPAAYIDFFMAHDDKAIALRIMKGFSDVLSQILSKTQRTIKTLETTFSRLKPTLSVHGIELSFSQASQEFDTVANIHEALKGLAVVAHKTQQPVIIFIDEFQDINNAEQARAIQGALRNIAQEHTEIVFIFSGSSRHLLLDIFDDQKKPFYMLCDKIELERMSSAHYLPYVQKAARAVWGKPLTETAYQAIIQCSELHPFYVNLLGHQLCQNPSIPTEKSVYAAWQQCLDNEKRRLVSEVEHLTLNQQKALKFLAHTPTTEPMAQASLNTVNLSSASMRLCLQFLLERDLVFKVAFEDPGLPLFKKGQYRVLDPLLAFYLRAF